MSKMTPTLAQKFRETPHEEPLEVVLDLSDEALHAIEQGDSSKQSREIFDGYAKPVIKKVRSLGGVITRGDGWLEGSLRATLTKNAVEGLNDEPLVARVDLPPLGERE